MNESLPDVSIILVSWNTRDLLLGCLESLSQAVGALQADIWVVDNGSIDGSVGSVRLRHPAVHVLTNAENVGFAAANNQAIRASSGRYVLLLNSDTVAEPGSVEALVRFADAHPWVAVTGPMLLNPDGSFQGSFADFPSLASECLSASGIGSRICGPWYPSYGPEHSQAHRRVDFVQGACMLVRRTAVKHVGLLDEDYFMYSEEVDWCLRMRRADWDVWYVPDARICHYGGQSTRQMRREMVQVLYRSKVRFFRRHYGAIQSVALQASLVLILRSKWLLQRLVAARSGRAALAPPISWRDLQTETALHIAGRTVSDY